MRLFSTAFASARVASEMTERLYSLSFDAVSYEKIIVSIALCSRCQCGTYMWLIDARVEASDGLWQTIICVELVQLFDSALKTPSSSRRN